MRPQLQSSPRGGPRRYHCRPQQEERGTQRRPAPSCSCAIVPLPFSSAAPQASRWTAWRALVTRHRRMALADAAHCSSRLCRALLRLILAALCSGLSSPRSAPACHRKGCAFGPRSRWVAGSVGHPMDFAWNAGWEAAPPACNPDPDQPGAAEGGGGVHDACLRAARRRLRAEASRRPRGSCSPPCQVIVLRWSCRGLGCCGP